MSTQEKDLHEAENCNTSTSCNSEKTAAQTKEEQDRLKVQADKKEEKPKHGSCGCG